MQNAINHGAYTRTYSAQVIMVLVLALGLSVPIHLGLLSGAKSLLLSSIFHGSDEATLIANASSKSAPLAGDFSNAFAWLLRAPTLSSTGEDIRINAHVALGMVSGSLGIFFALFLSGFLAPQSGLISAHVQSLQAHYRVPEEAIAHNGFAKFGYFMRRYFAHRYSNDVSGLAYMGAAMLIAVIGLRGLKIIPPTQPTPVLSAISLEFCLLMLLGITLYFTPEENEDLIVGASHQHHAIAHQPVTMQPPQIVVPEGTMLVSETERIHIPEALIRHVMMDIMRESMDTARSVESKTAQN